MAVLKLVASAAKSAATMSFDPTILTSLKECATLAFAEVQRRLALRTSQLALACDAIQIRAGQAAAHDCTALGDELLALQRVVLAEAQWQPAAAFALAV
eukprot:2109817-Prymnesium_polylepis.1